MEAGCLLEISVHTFLRRVSTMASWGDIVAHWRHPGRSWEQQEGHVGVRNQIVSDFGMMWGSNFECFLGSEMSNSVLFSGLFPRHVLP